MDPVTIGLALTAGAGWLFSRKKAGEPTAPPPPVCNSSKAVSTAIGSTVSGAAAGSAAPGIGTGVGAGIGLGLAATSDLTGPCGNAWIKHAEGQIHQLGQDACAKADRVLAALKAHGVAKPMGYDQLSCDQKLALVLSLSTPLGIFVAGVSEAAGTVGAVVSTTENNVEQEADKAASAVKSVGKKLGL